MRFLLPTLLLAAFATSPFAQDPDGQGGGVEIQTTTDWDQLLAIYKATQGGAERFDGVNYLAFDYEPYLLDEEGERVAQGSWHVETRFRDNADEQLQRVMRIETEVEVAGEEGRTIRTVGIVREDGMEVYREATDGSYEQLSSREILQKHADIAKALWAQLDQILYLDSRDLRCRYTGIMTRNKEKYVTVESGFRPAREVPEPSRLYFDTTTALIERIDVFDPATNTRIGSKLLEGYQDYDGIKFPSEIRFVNRDMEELGGWVFTTFKVNPELEKETFLKP